MAKTVLINGCSYANQWNPDKWFAGYDIVNIAECGGSNRRSMRTTVEWILENGNPDYVLLPVTFLNRTESFFDHNMNFANYINISFGFYANHKHGKLFEEVEAVEHPSVTLDRFLTDMIMFDSFLKQRNIPYLAWNMCTPKDGMPAFNVNESLELKMKWLKNNPRIVDWDFVGNVYLGQNGAAIDNPSETQWDIWARHYNKNHYYILEKYLNDYR